MKKFSEIIPKLSSIGVNKTRMNKAQRIKASLKATREKRRGQRCFAVKLKVNSK